MHCYTENKNQKNKNKKQNNNNNNKDLIADTIEMENRFKKSG